MRKPSFTGFACLVALLFGISAYAQTAETYVSPDDFATKFWKEKYFGGGDGKPGNVLMAVGEGFVFQNATLESVTPLTALPTEMIPACASSGSVPGYQTTYTGGRLTLNPSGPWEDDITVRDIAATNYSGQDSNGKRFFTLVFGGVSRDDVEVDVVATWCETEDNYRRQVTKKKAKPVYQKGTGFEAEITITPAP